MQRVVYNGATDMEMTAWLGLTGSALATSAVSGLAGTAGGIMMLGAMTVFLPPAAVVPLHGIVQLASNATRIAVFLRHVAWRFFLPYAAGVSLGTAAGAWVWSGEMTWFRPGIGLFILGFLLWRRKAPRLRSFRAGWYFPAGLAAGFLAIYAGAVGPFIGPLFLRDDLAKEQIVATQASCQAWTHLLKIPAFSALGFSFAPHARLLAALVACVIGGNLLGKALLERISQQAFLRVFEGLLAAVAVYLLATP